MRLERDDTRVFSVSEIVFGYCTGVFFPNKISGMGTIFGLLVHVLPGTNKQRARKKKYDFELN